MLYFFRVVVLPHIYPSSMHGVKAVCRAVMLPFLKL